MRLSSIILGASFCFTATATTTPSDIYSTFINNSTVWDARTTIAFPGSTAFVNATDRWNGYVMPTYSVAITPATEGDVSQALLIARSIDLPLLGTGGRHATSTTLSELKNGLAIDLSNLNSVSVDAKAATLTVGGGAQFGDIYHDVYNAGFEMPVGSCSCPGVVGATIGAGVGRYQGLHGLIIDNLLAVRLVTAEGNIINVSNDTNSDLFWGIRGAGANFGIITSATYMLHPLVNEGQILNADFIIPASQNGSYFDLIQSFEDGMPAELSTVSLMEFNDTIGEAQILVNWVYIGPEDKGRELIAPVLNLNPVVTDIRMVQYNTLVDVALFGLGRSICADTYIDGYGVNYRNLSSSTFQGIFQTLSDFYVDHPDGRDSTVELEIFANEAVAAVADDATAYPWRDTKGYALISFSWNSSATQEAGRVTAHEVRSSFVETSGYDDLAVYVSYTQGDETLSQIFGGNLPRLTQIKKKWDPNNVFRFYHALPTE
ncbi:Glucooligosaccharide oxidase [Xylaria cf. heliscus]|nr:Glucooligosaccharide oxidase [Xylaria cf. heliscus]